MNRIAGAMRDSPNNPMVGGGMPVDQAVAVAGLMVED